jgi:hypothetical protein
MVLMMIVIEVWVKKAIFRSVLFYMATPFSLLIDATIIGNRRITINESSQEQVERP